MSEWLKEHAWKACVGETLPRVRIPLSPPAFARPTRERASARQARELTEPREGCHAVASATSLPHRPASEVRRDVLPRVNLLVLDGRDPRPRSEPPGRRAGAPGGTPPGPGRGRARAPSPIARCTTQ